MFIKQQVKFYSQKINEPKFRTIGFKLIFSFAEKNFVKLFFNFVEKLTSKACLLNFCVAKILEEFLDYVGLQALLAYSFRKKSNPE